MRTRLSPQQRRADILDKAAQLFLQQGFATTEMEDIRLACGISRGGLYHHFKNKRAILDAIVQAEIHDLAKVLTENNASPVTALLQAGSSRLGNAQGIIASLTSDSEKLDYLSSLDQAINTILSPVLQERLQYFVKAAINPVHVAELFLTINSHINRRVFLGQWNNSDAAGFTITALQALAPLLRDPAELNSLIRQLQQKDTVQ